jgi:ATP-dependent RNA helicase DeaD
MSARTGAKADGFAGLGLAPALVSVLAELGYEEPTPIQNDAIPPLLAGRDLLGQAATGTGKTAAFALPLLQLHLTEARRAAGPALIVLVPTRELAMQVAEALHRYGSKLGARVLPIYGGQSMSLQFRALSRGVDAVVATPGRVLDHIRRGTLKLDAVRAVVLDEADEMLDMGFSEDLDAILEALPSERQTALFSATIPKRIASIAERHLRAPVRIAIPDERLERGEAPRVRQAAYLVSRAHKVDALGRILDHESPTSALVFCRTRNEVEELAEALRAHGYRAEALHGGLSQKDRDRVMRRFREGVAELLLATDVAARGLDIGRVSHVINFDVPSAPESYVHRIGRTGRAGREGVAVTLVEPRERHLLRNIERLTGRRLEHKPVPTVADLRARQLEQTRATVREALLAGGVEPFREVVESLAQEFDPIDVAAAAVKLALGGRSLPEGADIPAPAPGPSPDEKRPARRGKPARDERPTAKPGRDERPAAKAPGAGPFTKIYISAGQSSGVRAADLVGAITGEAGLDGRDVGPIEIADRYSLVDVRKSRADEALDALRRTKIRGHKVTASRYRPPREKR